MEKTESLSQERYKSETQLAEGHDYCRARKERHAKHGRAACPGVEILRGNSRSVRSGLASTVEGTKPKYQPVLVCGHWAAQA